MSLRRQNRLEGSTFVFSALNREALRAVRYDDRALAEELAGEAATLERDSLDAWVREANDWYASRPIDDDGIIAPAEGLWRPGPGAARRWSRQLLRDAADEAPELLTVLADAATAADAVRDRLSDRLGPANTTLARVWRIGDVRTELRPLDTELAEPFSFLTEEVLAAGLRLGDAVSVRHEAIAPGVVITTLDPAVDLRPRGKRLSPRPSPVHLDELLDESERPKRATSPAPLRRVA